MHSQFMHACMGRPEMRPLDQLEPQRPDAWPLLVLDPGRTRDARSFLARCRWCGWKSTRESTPAAALAAFKVHSCQERPT